MLFCSNFLNLTHLYDLVILLGIDGLMEVLFGVDPNNALKVLWRLFFGKCFIMLARALFHLAFNVFCTETV